METKKAAPKPQDTDVALSAIHEALNPGQALPDWMAPVKPPAVASYVKQDPHVGDFTVFDKSHKPVESFLTEEKATKFAAKWDEKFGEGPTNTQASGLPSKDGYTLSSAANKDFPESAKDYFVHDPAGKEIGQLTHVEEEKHNDISSTPAHWQLSMEGVAPKGGSSLEDLMHYIPGWHKSAAAPATKPPASLPSKEGYTLSSAANPDFPESAKDYFVHDPSGKKIGDLTYVEEIQHDDMSSTPAYWQLYMEGAAPKVGFLRT